jgi:hypothetical protein
MGRILKGIGTVVVGAAIAVGSIVSGSGAASHTTPQRQAPLATRNSATAAVVAVPAPQGGPPLEDITVILYGDSLAWEAQEFFRDRLVAAGVRDVRTETHGGTAICDWFDEMQRDAAAVHPDVVVLEFSGNALTPCMMNAERVSLATDRAAWHQKYVNDAEEAVRIFAASGTRVYLTGSPRSRAAELRNDPDINWFNSMYEALATYSPQTAYLDAGAAVLRDGRWTETLPCLPGEPCAGSGVNVVRAPDGGHFCPDAPDAMRGVTVACTAWSSGAYRYGTSMADGVVARLHEPSLG